MFAFFLTGTYNFGVGAPGGSVVRIVTAVGFEVVGSSLGRNTILQNFGLTAGVYFYFL